MMMHLITLYFVEISLLDVDPLFQECSKTETERLQQDI